MKISKKTIIQVIFIIWTMLWVNFIFRDLFKMKYFQDYLALMKRNQEQRRSYVYGDEFYKFLKFSMKSLPEDSTYKLIGLKDLSLDYRRAVYYLYPLVQSDEAHYILVYNNGAYREAGYSFFSRLDNNSFILKKR